jgi:hypothetical protein
MSNGSMLLTIGAATGLYGSRPHFDASQAVLSEPNQYMSGYLQPQPITRMVLSFGRILRNVTPF